jgi:tetratricopeptide (TPR) repeat protein
LSGVEVIPMLPDDTQRQTNELDGNKNSPMVSGLTLAGERSPARTVPACAGPRALTKYRVAIRSGRQVLVLHSAIALTCIFGCQNSQPTPGQPVAAPIATQKVATQHDKRGQEAVDASAVRSRLVVLGVGKENDARQVVILGKPTGVREIPEFGQPSRPDMLPREMVRQAVLIAARDELGLATRDQVIDDTSTDQKEGGAGTVEVVSFIRDNRSREMIQRLEGELRETILSHETPTTPGPDLELLKLLASAEALSRGEFPTALKGLGLVGKPNTVNEVAALPEKTDERLATLEFLDALLAVRDLHKAIRDDGESSARLGALARGYALLGVLSEFQWHPAHRAFKARALLYAQRMIAHHADQPLGLWNRAFALALIGRHGDALADLEEAKKKAETVGSTPAAPDWVEVVDAFARCDSARMAGVQGAQKRLAALLRMFTLAFPRTTAVGLHAASDVVTLQPYCFRAHDAMSDFFGVSTQHATTMMGPLALEHFISNKLPAVKELPAGVKDQLAGDRAIVRVAELLDQAGAPASDAGEPAWGVMGHMLRETRFVQVFRRIYFMRVMLSVPVDDVWNEVRGDVAGHRYHPYLLALALPGRETALGFEKFADGYDLIDIETTESAMIQSLWKLNRPRPKAAWAIAMAHEDQTAEMALSLSQVADQSKLDVAQSILKVSPFHPFARATLISRAWDTVRDKIPAWEKESGDSPAFLAALAMHYSAAKSYDEAQPVLARYIELSPDVWAFQSLAANFKAQGKIDRWQETLDEFLNKVDDLGLDHAKVRVEIAEHFIGLKQWEKARPYAEAAAQTWAEWAMECAGRCAEGEKDWERAEGWYSRATERYPDNSWAVWYFFCKRTGHGKLEAGREFAERYVTARAAHPEMLNPEYAGCFYWLDGRPALAKEAFGKAHEHSSSVSAALCLAMIADEEKDAGRRDQLLNEIVTKHADKAPKSAAVCRSFVDTIFNPGGTKPPDIAALDRLIEETPEVGRGNMRFFVGWFLKNHGDSTSAKKYLQGCSQSPQSLIWYRYLADQAIKLFSGKAGESEKSP